MEIIGICLDCEDEVQFKEMPVIGEIAVCPSCGLELEVKGVGDSGVIFQYAPKEAEDWGE